MRSVDLRIYGCEDKLWGTVLLRLTATANLACSFSVFFKTLVGEIKLEKSVLMKLLASLLVLWKS